MPRLFYPFLVYRSFFFPFFALSAIVVPCWLLFRLYRLRTSRQPLALRRELVLLTFVLYLSGLASATLAPNRPSRLHADDTMGMELHPNLAALTCPPAISRTDPNARFFCLYNARGNVLLFVPLGILIPLAWRRIGFLKGILIAIAVSISVETVQYFSRAWGSYRLADVNDVILNAVGAVIGLTLVSLLLRFRGMSGGPRPIRE
ncbi:MAG: VanZ family protein [Gemmatimonadaceae bacterium]